MSLMVAIVCVLTLIQESLI